MPYALFEKEFRLSRTFPTANDVWRCAEDCGLVIDEANGRQRLDDGYAIKPCPPDSPECAQPADPWLNKSDPSRNESAASKLTPQVRQPPER